MPGESNERRARPLSPECIEVLQQLGINAYNSDAIEQLADDLRWLRDERKRQAQRDTDQAADRRDRKTRIYALGYGLLATAVGSLGTWLISHLRLL